jgi:hypothetical protein
MATKDNQDNNQNELQEIVVKIPLYQQQELSRDVKKHGELLARLDERLERMDHDLFGNGQPGTLKTMEQSIEATSKRVLTLEKSESHLKGWVAGVLAVALFIGGFAEFLYHMGHAAK